MQGGGGGGGGGKIGIKGRSQVSEIEKEGLFFDEKIEYDILDAKNLEIFN